MKFNNGINRSAKLAVGLAVFSAIAMGQSLSNFTCSPTSIPIGSSTTCTASISSGASLSGFVVRISTTGTGLQFPTSVSIPWLSSAVSFTVTTSGSTPAQTAVLNATAGTITKSSSVTIGTATYSLTSFSCTPATLIPGQATICQGSLSAAAPSGGLIAFVTSNSADLPVPASVSIAAGGSGLKFSTSAPLTVSVKESITLNATVLSSSRSTGVTIDPTPKFSLKGNNQELSLLANGAVVQPSVAPSGWLGTLTVRGAGYIALDPVSGSDGMSFHQNGGQNTNTAFINFSGTPVGQVFQTASEISLLLKSGYSYTERLALPSSNMRTAFEVFDNTSSLYNFSTYTTSTGQLQFSFAALGIVATYTVPSGKEDLIFGKGVVASIRIAWAGNSLSLYVNGTLVQKNTISPKVANWSSLSALTIGSRSARTAGGGYYASDDSIADFMIR
jgi:hypothetical protein